MTWTTAVDDLRTFLSDGPTDHHCYRKKCFGDINGTNKDFKTFDVRRVTDLTAATPTNLGAFVDGVRVSVASDSVMTGDFTLTTAPVDGSVVEASYYIQWFLDTELTVFLQYAMSWLGFGTDFTTLADGLKPAAIHYATSEAYLKLAMRWRTHLSEMYRVEDAPDKKANSAADSYTDLAKAFQKSATELRKSFYTRQGQNDQPYFGVASGCVQDPTPRS